MRMMPLIAAALLLAGCVTTPIEPADLSFEDVLAPRAWTRSLLFSEVATASDAAPEAFVFAFDVPDGATSVAARLSWMSSAARLDLVLKDAEGELVGRGFPENPTTRALATWEAPRTGEWMVEVAATRALEEAFQVEVVVSSAPADARVYEERYSLWPRTVPNEAVRPGNGGYAEINLVLAEGQSFTYSWSASSEVYFNIHYHADGETVRFAEETSRGSDGIFEAPLTQVISLLWANQGAAPLTVDVRVEGIFREHSRTR